MEGIRAFSSAVAQCRNTDISLSIWIDTPHMSSPRLRPFLSCRFPLSLSLKTLLCHVTLRIAKSSPNEKRVGHMRTTLPCCVAVQVNLRNCFPTEPTTLGLFGGSAARHPSESYAVLDYSTKRNLNPRHDIWRLFRLAPFAPTVSILK